MPSLGKLACFLACFSSAQGSRNRDQKGLLQTAVPLLRERNGNGTGTGLRRAHNFRIPFVIGGMSRQPSGNRSHERSGPSICRLPATPSFSGGCVRGYNVLLRSIGKLVAWPAREMPSFGHPLVELCYERGDTRGHIAGIPLRLLAERRALFVDRWSLLPYLHGCSALPQNDLQEQRCTLAVPG